jgi:hypothetical protein
VGGEWEWSEGRRVHQEGESSSLGMSRAGDGKSTAGKGKGQEC